MNTKHLLLEGLNGVIQRIKEKEQACLSTLHTDQGAVYSSETFNLLLSNNNIIHSMSRTGTPTDNPIDESLNGWIKDELLIDFNLKKCDDVLSLIKNILIITILDDQCIVSNIKPHINIKSTWGIRFFLDCLLFID